MTTRNAERGFTLTELLVATAIFAIIMSAVAALFVASLSAVRSGYQSQEAFETARGTFNVLERDLTTVFTSRDFGQHYQFYGNEYGMTMVGLIRSRDASGREYSRIGRITYVIYPVVLRGNDGAYYVTEPFAYEYARRTGIADAGLSIEGFYRTRGVRYTGPDPNSDAGSVEIAVAALIRYVEPGVSDLDSFPFDWNELAQFYQGNPEYPPAGNGLTIREQLDSSLEFTTGPANPSSDTRILARLDSAREQMFAAKKRDLWLRMLSCQEYWIPQLNTGAAILPNPWGRRDPNTQAVMEPSWLLGGPNAAGNTNVVDPRDFAIAENIGVSTGANAVGFPMRPYRPTAPFVPFFEYGRVNADTIPDLLPMWGANRLAYINPDYANDGIDNDNDNALLVNDGVDNNYNGLIDEPNEGIDEPDERLVAPRIDQTDSTQSINLLELDGIDNDFDGVVDEAGETVDNDLAYGSPLQPRLPEAVLVRMPLTYPPAHFNAPVFERNMEQLIDVPTAYTRSQLAYEGP